MNTFCRPLNDARLVQHFVENILEITNQNEITRAVKLIVSTELQNSITAAKSTLHHEDFRLKYVDNKSRMKLRKRIFEELVFNERPSDDEQIRLGYGGALPIGIRPKQDRQAYIVIGLPASGKSTISNKISDNFGAIILDSDFAKRKLPEYKQPFGASIVHEESTDIVFGEQNIAEFNMLHYCCATNTNIVIPRIGHSTKPILDLAKKLIDCQYDVHLILVSLDRLKATQRAYLRYVKTRRYVPLSLIFDGYANDPILSYYRLRNNLFFKSYGKISTDVEKNFPPKFIEGTIGNPAKLFE